MVERICATCPRPMRANNLAICRRCEEELRRRIGNQAGHLSELELEYLRQTNKVEALRRAGREFPILFEVKASRLMVRQQALLNTWVEAIPRRAVTGPVCRPLCVHSSCQVIRASWLPLSRSVPVVAIWLLTHLSALRRRAEAGKFLLELRDLDADIITLIDLPIVKTRIHVGPCPNRWPTETGGEEWCPGQVDAYVPADETAPAYMRCDACGAEWPSRYWATTGDEIKARAAQLETQRRLAQAIAKTGVA